MTQSSKALLLLSVSYLLLVSLSGCSSTTVIEPNGFLYAANSFRPGSMSGFSVTEGGLGHLTNSPFVTGGNAPYSLAVVSTKFVYGGVPATPKGGVITRLLGRTLSGSVTGGILMMAITSQGMNQETLNMPPSMPQMFATGGDYDPLAVTPDGKFLYAANLTSNHLDAFSIDSSKGTLTALGSQGPPAVGHDLFNVVVDPQGKFLFVANCDFTSPSTPPQGSVSVFAINSDGTLTPVPGSPFLLGPDVSHLGASHPVALAVSPDNHFLFIASLDDKVYVESISSTGALSDAVTGMPSVSLPAGSMPVAIAVSSDGGNTVYTGNAGTGTVSFFLNCVQSTMPTGCSSVTPPVCSGTAPLCFQNNTSVGGAIGVVLADPTSIAASSTTSAVNVGHFLYVTDYDHGTIVVFSVTSTTACTAYPNTSSCTPIPGTITQSGSADDTGGANPYGLAMAH